MNAGSIIVLRQKAGGMGYILNELVMGLPTDGRQSNNLDWNSGMLGDG